LKKADEEEKEMKAWVGIKKEDLKLHLKKIDDGEAEGRYEADWEEWGRGGPAGRCADEDATAALSWLGILLGVDMILFLNPLTLVGLLPFPSS
jgi:hypothetical protein